MIEGVEGYVGDVFNNIDLVMVANTQESQEHNNNDYELCVESNDISKKMNLKMPNNDIENYVEEDRWDYSNECNKWKGGDSETITNPNRIEFSTTMTVMTELEMMKWQIYFSH